MKKIVPSLLRLAPRKSASTSLRSRSIPSLLFCVQSAARWPQPQNARLSLARPWINPEVWGGLVWLNGKPPETTNGGLVWFGVARGWFGFFQNPEPTCPDPQIRPARSCRASPSSPSPSTCCPSATRRLARLTRPSPKNYPEKREGV